VVANVANDGAINNTEGCDPTTMTIDAQVHAYERNHAGRPWIGHLHGPASATGDEMVAAMDAVGVDAALLIYSLYRYDASYALKMGAAHPGRFGLIKPVDLGPQETFVP
jgi:L-fuconolactonase